MSYEKILTISIAAYNMEKYLDEALSSLIEPSCIDLLDVIIVNDGSTDRTPEIANKYVEMYPDSFTLINKENGGYGSTINCALTQARGKYFKLLDGDDWYETRNMNSFLEKLQMTDADMVYTQYSRYNQDASQLIAVKPLPYRSNELLDITELNEMMMHALAVRTELIRGITITEHCLYTDTEYFLKAALCCRTMIAFPINIYCYRLGREGQSVSDSGFLKHVAEYESVTRYAVITIKENECLTGLQKPMFGIIRRTYMTLLKSPRTINNINTLFSFRSFIQENADYAPGYMDRFMRITYFYPFLMLLPYPLIEKLFWMGHQVKSFVRKLLHRQ